jgi:hypothetical protein
MRVLCFEDGKIEEDDLHFFPFEYQPALSNKGEEKDKKTGLNCG